MAKHYLVFFLVATLALSGCVMGPEFKAVREQKVENIVFPMPPDEPRFYYERTLQSTADVKPDTDADAFRRAMTGEQRQGEGLSKPYGVAVHRGRVYVGDTVRRTVVVFDIPEQKFFYIGESDPGGLAMPLGLDVDGQGNLYVVDGITKKITVYDRSGKFLRSIADPTGGTSWFHKPAGLAVDVSGHRVYVVDIGGVDTQEHRVRVFDAQSGEHLFDFGKRGDKPGEFNLPRDITVAPDGSLYVVDGGNFRVQQFRDDGTLIRVFGSIGRQGGQFSRPKEVAVDKDGNVYVADAAFGNFQIFTPDGQLLLAVGGRSTANGPAKFLLPSGIAVDEDGRVYMVDQFFRKVDVFRPAALAPEAGFLGRKAVAK